MNDIPEDEPMEGPASEDLSASRPALGLPESRPGRVPETPPTSPESRIQGGSIRIFRVAGIDVFLHWSWFLFAVLS